MQRDFFTRFWDAVCLFSNEFILLLRMSVLLLVLSLFSLLFVESKASFVVLQIDFLVVTIMMLGSAGILIRCRQW